MSWNKFQRQNSNKDIKWFRAKQDGAPFRTHGELPLLREAEYEAYSERVYDAKVGLFDTSQPNQKLPEGDPEARTYREVIESSYANWFKLVCPRQYRWGKDEYGNPKMYVYVEWVEPYLELAKDLKNRT